MTTLIVVSSPLGNMHNVKVEHCDGDRVTEEQLVRPGETATMRVWADGKIVITETMQHSLTEQT